MALLEQYGSTAESMPILHQVIATLNDPFPRRAFHTALIAEWVQVDPAGGSAFFFAEGSDARQRRQFFEEWLEENPQAAVDALLVGGSGWERLARDLLPGIAGKMPWRVAEISSRLPEEPDPLGEPKVKDAFVILARSDLADAVREAGKVTGPNRDQALAGVAQVWAKADFHGAIEWARGLPDGIDRDEIIRAALLGKAAVDPIGALESADLVPAGGRAHYFASTTGARVLVEAAKTDFDTTIAWLAQHPERLRQADLLAGLSQPVTERLLSDAAGFLTEHQLNGSLGILVPAIGSALLNQASGQRQATWDWLQLQWDGEPVRELTREVLMSAGFHDPTRAMRWVDDLSANAEADPLVELIATSVLNGGWQLHRLDSFLEDAPARLRVPLIESAFKFLGPKVLDDPQRWVARLPLLPEEARDAGIERLAKVWSMQAPEEALGWAATLASGEPRNQALAVITGNWAGMDPYHAAEWVGSLPPGTAMKWFVQLMVILGAAVLGLAIGSVLRGKNFGAEQSQETPVVAPLPQHEPQIFQRRTGTRWVDDSPLATELERNLTTAPGATRWLYWMEALEKAAPTDFPRLAQLAEENSTATRLLAARWIDLDPRHLFDTMMAASKQGRYFPLYEAGEMLFEEWSKRDPAAVIAALNENPSARHTWGMLVASAMMRTDVERGLHLLWDWHITHYTPSMNGVAPWAAQNPRHAAGFILERPIGDGSNAAMEIVGIEWAKVDPGGALEFAADNLGNLGTVLGRTVMKEWAGRDFDAAADWLVETSPGARARFSSSFIEAWAKVDAAGALAWSEQNLTGTDLAAAVTGVVKGAAEVDIHRAEALVAAMHPSHARAEAAVVVARDLFPKHSSNESMNPETVAWLGGLDGGSVKRVLSETGLRWRWIESDPQSMALFLSSLSGESAPHRADTELAGELARRNPDAALQWAAGLPGERGLSAGATAFNQWFGAQPAEAVQWLRDLPPEDQRRGPFFEKAIFSLAHELRASEVLAVMPPADRNAARSIIQEMVLPENRRRLLLDALSQP
jgi:hypothetical protein